MHRKSRICCGLLAGGEIVAGSGRSSLALGARAVMRPAASPRETFASAAIASFEAARSAVRLRRLRAGDEGRQAVDIAGVGDDRLRLVRRLRLLILRLRTMVAFAVLARLLVANIGLLVIVALLIVAIVIALAVTLIGLLLLRRLRNEARLLAEILEILAVVLAVVTAAGADGLVAARLLVLAELFLRRRDQAEIMLGVLVVVFGGDRVARGARVTRKLKIFFGDVRGGAADLDVGAVRFVDPGHRVLAAPVIVVVIVIVVVPVTHTLVVVLTVSHVLPLFQPCSCSLDVGALILQP
jgi:hypothetical protein